MKSKLLHYRPFTLIFIGLLIGIFLAGSFLLSKNMLFYLLLGVAGIILISLLLVLIFNRKIIYYKHLVKILTLAILSIILGASSLLAFVGGKLHKQDQIINNTSETNIEATITGRINNIIFTDNTYKFVIENVSINAADYNCKIQVSNFLEQLDLGLKLGDYIKFEAKIFVADAINSKFNSNVLTQEIFFNGYISSGEVEVYDNDCTLLEKIRTKTDADLKLYSSTENYGILKALLLGDKSNLDAETYQTFGKSGLAHILSISGLHVGFIVLLLCFVLKKLKANTKVQFVSVIIFLLLYCSLCNFASSVVRASVMSICFMLSGVLGKRSDGLSSIGLAGTILLISNPLNAYNLGFRLSFCAMLGIILLAKPIKDLLIKVKLPEVISTSIATTLSAELFTLPIVAEIFGYIPIFNFIINIILLPLFSIYFSILFIAFLINIILPFGFLYYPLSYLFNIFTAISGLFATFKIINLTKMYDIVTIIYYALLFLLSSFVLINNKSKIITTVIAIIICISSIIVTDKIYSNNSLTLFKDLKATSIYTTKTNEKILMLDNISKSDYYSLKQYLYNLQITKINYVVLLDYSTDTTSIATNLEQTYKISTFYYSSTLQDNDQLGLINNFDPNKLESVNLENFIIANTVINVIKNQDLSLGFKLQENNLTFIYLNDNFTESEIDIINGAHVTLIFENMPNFIIDYLINGELSFNKIIVKNKPENINYDFIKTLNGYYFTYSF